MTSRGQPGGTPGQQAQEDCVSRSEVGLVDAYRRIADEDQVL
jgi:hypothetical protein